jgi:hypothetical protein
MSFIPVTIHDLHLGVVAGTGFPGQTLSVNQPVVHGTAFPIAPGLFMTANHVLNFALDDAGKDGVVALFRKGPQQVEAGAVGKHESLPGLDLALLSCPYFRALLPVPILFRPLDIYTSVSAAGYPYAVDPERLAFAPRGFAGHVITRRELYHLPSQPPGYEVSFPSPRGLSGAPLLMQDETGAWCCGTMIENWRYASGDFVAGVAIASEAFLSIKSTILGRPLAEVLGERYRPLGPPTPIRNPLIIPFDVSADGWPDVDDLNEEDDEK